MRHPHRGAGRNTFREHYEEKVAAAQERYRGDLSDQRARIFLLNGPPAEVLESACPLLLVPLEIWYYAESDQVQEQFIVIFYRRWASTPFRVWDPRDGIDVFFNEGAWTAGPEGGGAQTGRGANVGRGDAGGQRGQAHSLGELTDPMNGCGDPDKAVKIAAAVAFFVFGVALLVEGLRA